MGRPGFWLLTIALSLGTVVCGFAQSPIFHYTLQIDSSDLSHYSITLRIEHAPHHFRLAMATHHEYDDRYWRFVTRFTVQSPATFSREDSAVWAVSTPDSSTVITYRIQLPPPPPFHFSHRPFLTPHGGLVGDLHSFLYLVDDPQAICHLTLELPSDWQAATGLDPTTALDPATGFAPVKASDNASISFTATTPQLLDAPVLIGKLHRWSFKVDGITHEAAYLPAEGAVAFDTIALVANIEKIVRASADIFGGFPYQHYSFLLEDNSAGALEHGNSVTIGVQAKELAATQPDIYGQITHEFFHTWNLMHIRPSPYTNLNYGPQQQSPGLWFSEGVTMFYADLIGRRTMLTVEDSTRTSHLASVITRYYRDTGNMVISPTKVSLVSNLQPGPLGDYSASTHLQGELLGTCLDILIRDATDGRQTLDDAMRELYRRFSDKQTISDRDIEAAVTTVCGCSEAHTFFKDHLTEGKQIDFVPWLGRLGLRFQHDQLPAFDRQGRLEPDNRIYPWILRDDTSIRIGISNPNSCWALAGLHTGDIVSDVNGRPIHTRQDFQSAVSALSVGDTVLVWIKKGNKMTAHKIQVSGYTKPVITISIDPSPTPRQCRLLDQWIIGK